MADFPLYGGSEQVSAGFVLANVEGTDLTSGLANTKGAYVELLSAANNTSNSTSIEVVLQMNVSGTVTAQLLIDIAIGGAGSEEVIIPNLWYYSDNSLLHNVDTAYFPINIPEGVRISARMQSDLASVIAPLHINLTNSGFQQPASLSEVVDIGTDTSITGAVLVARSTTPGVFGSWVEIIASTVDEYSGFLVCAHRAADSWANTLALAYDVGVGSAGNEEIIMELSYATQGATETGHGMVTPYKPINIAKGSRLAIRAVGNANNSDLDYEYAIYGVK
jgi:hypothetical protein